MATGKGKRFHHYRKKWFLEVNEWKLEKRIPSIFHIIFFPFDTEIDLWTHRPTYPHSQTFTRTHSSLGCL